MNKTKRRIDRYSYHLIGLIFYFIFIGASNVYGQSNKDSIINPKIIQLPPPYDPGYVPDPDTMMVYSFPDIKPNFPGNMNKYFADSIRYPEDAKKKNIQGIVFLSITIERDGSISNIGILRSPDSSLSMEAKRVVSTMPRWVPGRRKGVIVRVQSIVSVHFKIQIAQSGSTMKK